MAGQSGDLVEKLKVNLDPEGEVPVIGGEAKGEVELRLGVERCCCSSLGKSAHTYMQKRYDLRNFERMYVTKLVQLIPSFSLER